MQTDLQAQMRALTRALADLTRQLQWQQPQLYTLRQLGERYGMHPKTVRRRLIELGLHEQCGTSETVRVPIETVQQLDRILKGD